MASKILVDELAPYSHATDVTLATGKNITGANTQFKITGGSNTEMLTTNGAGALSWTAQPTAGLSYASQWRINTQVSVSGVEPGTILSANWETPAAAEIPGEIGSAYPMVVNGSTGAWTFPATGVWYCEFSCAVKANTGNHMVNLYLMTTTDTASSWQRAAFADRYNETNYTQPISINYLANISNVSTHMVRFSIGTDTQSSELMANTSSNFAFATFIKLGDAS